MPLVSVVMPAYNAEKTLAESINSLAAQTFRDFEIVIVDDGSSDRTPEIADRYAALLPLRLVRNPENLGVSASLNRGIAASDSRFIARLDSDDIAVPNRLELQLAFLAAHPEVDLCGSNVRSVR